MKNNIGSIIHDVFSFNCPEGGFAICGENYEDIQWFRNDEKPTLAQVQQWVKDFENNEVLYNYKAHRAISYSALTEQLDQIWHDIDKGSLDKTGDFYQHIKSVKDSFPKYVKEV